MRAVLIGLGSTALLALIAWSTHQHDTGTHALAPPAVSTPERTPLATRPSLPSSESRSAESVVTPPIAETQAEEPTFGQLVGQVLRADGSPCQGGMLGFLEGEFGVEQKVSKFSVSSDGYYSTGEIPIRTEGLGRRPSSQRALGSGWYTPLYRATSQDGWQVLENLYADPDHVVVPKNGVITQDFILKEGFDIAGQLRLDLEFLEDDSLNLTCPITIRSLGPGGKVVAVGSTRMYGTDNERRVTRRRLRFEGDTRTVESGDFSFSGIPSGDYVLRLSVVVGPTAKQRNLVHIARSFSITDRDEVFDPEVLTWDEFAPLDPPKIQSLRPAPH